MGIFTSKRSVVTEFVNVPTLAQKKFNFLHALARHQQFFHKKSAEFSFKMRSKIHRTESE